MKADTKKTLKTLSTVLTMTVLLALARNVAMAGDDSDSNVLPPNSHPDGKTYGQWSASWWKWAMELPVTGPIPHPFFDDPAFDVTEGQRGDVWFLAAPFGTVVRNITIPHGKALFVGLLNAESSDLEGLGSSAHDQRTNAIWQANHIMNVTCSVDGLAVKNIAKYRVVSPQFTFNAPTPWLFGTTGGAGTSVADGYYVMVEPLCAGSHTIRYSGGIHFAVAEGDPYDYDASLDMTYHLTVLPEDLGNRGVAPRDSKPHGMSYDEWSVRWWQWVFSLPANNSPILDTGDCSAGQSGHVWFLAGAFAPTTVTRQCTIPPGTALFFPLANGWADNTGCPYTTFTAQELANFAASFVDAAGPVTCTIDGVAVKYVANAATSPYRVGPQVFSYKLARRDNILANYFGATCIADGIVVTPAAEDGEYLMLEPLPAGHHTIHFTVQEYLDITYRLTVLKK
jgi:hypothetical protein